jgi:hypothetical protein
MPTEVLGALGSSLSLSIGSSMGAAVLLSICSEADAFVATSLTFFPAAARLAFVAYGPLIDLKQLTMFVRTFHWRVLIVLVIVPTLLVFLGSLLLGFHLNYHMGFAP